VTVGVVMKHEMHDSEIPAITVVQHFEPGYISKKASVKIGHNKGFPKRVHAQTEPRVFPRSRSDRHFAQHDGALISLSSPFCYILWQS
jgi:hypothetical protein